MHRQVWRSRGSSRMQSPPTAKNLKRQPSAPCAMRRVVTHEFVMDRTHAKATNSGSDARAEASLPHQRRCGGVSMTLQRHQVSRSSGQDSRDCSRRGKLNKVPLDMPL